MFTLMEVRCSVRPICSAMPMKRCEKMASWMGSQPTSAAAVSPLAAAAVPPAATAAPPAAADAAPRPLVDAAAGGGGGTSIRRSRPGVRCAVQPGSITTVNISSSSMAGPGMTWPGERSGRA